MRQDAGSSDVPLDTPRDAPIDVGADAPAGACPPPSDLGFRVELDSLAGLGEWQEVAMGGDGRVVAMLFSAFDGSGLLSVRTAEGERSHRLSQVRSPQVSVEDGVVRALVTNDRGRQSLYTATGLGNLDEVAIVPPTGPLLTYDRPRWNGREVILTGTDARGGVVLAWGPGWARPPWFESAGANMARAAIDTLGRTHVLMRDADGRGRVTVFDVDGAPLGVPVALDPFFFRAFQLGWSDDGLGQPWIVAGTSGAGPAGGRLVISRHREDGTMGGGFSAGFGGGAVEGAADLTTVPPPDHRHGYGMVAATRLESPAFFHGAGEGFVGDARELPYPCDGRRVAIAAGPCGYVIACSSDGRVPIFLAVAPRPR